VPEQKALAFKPAGIGLFWFFGGQWQLDFWDWIPFFSYWDYWHFQVITAIGTVY